MRGSILEGQSLSRYAYVNGNPISYIDPFGLSRDSDDYGWGFLPKGWRSAPNWVPFSDSYFRDYDRNVQVFADEMDGIGESYGVPAGLLSGATKGVVNVGNFFMVEELRMFADPNAADGDKMLALVTGLTPE